MIGWLERHMLPCAYKSIFGIDCPGCGFQRSLIALLKGDFVHSFILYQATVPLILTGLFLIVDSRYHFENSKRIRRVLYILLGLIVIVSYSFKMYRLAIS